MELINPATLEGWLSPHSIEWYKQLSKLEGKYIYPWHSFLEEPNGESIFDEEVIQMAANKKVLDVGCGHGEFTVRCSEFAEEIVGFDVTEDFVQIGLANKKSNVAFVVGNSKQGFPFKNNEFDFAYIRKGPTSAYPYLKRVVKKGGSIMGLHPGDESNKELPLLFPNLFESKYGTPILDTIKERVDNSNYTFSSIEVINSIEYIKSPEGILMLRCFGQQPKIYETLKEKNLTEVTRIFHLNALQEGLPITFSRYLVRVVV